jgi:hypothetical protein
MGFRKAELKKSQREHGTVQVKDVKSYAYAVFRCAVVCKSEHRGFKKAKERAWDSASLRAKTLREIMLKKS